MARSRDGWRGMGGLVGCALLGAAVSAGALGGVGCSGQQASSEQHGTSTSIVIHQEIDFSVPPARVYEALLDSKQFTEFSGRAAEIDRSVGGVFSVFKGHIVGRNLELVPDQRIVQAWRVVTWPEGAYSMARFELKPQGSGGSGTRLVFEHIGFPEGLHDHLAEGWEENYWTLLKKYLR